MPICWLSAQAQQKLNHPSPPPPPPEFSLKDWCFWLFWFFPMVFNGTNPHALVLLVWITFVAPFIGLGLDWSGVVCVGPFGIGMCWALLEPRQTNQNQPRPTRTNTDQPRPSQTNPDHHLPSGWVWVGFGCCFCMVLSRLHEECHQNNKNQADVCQTVLAEVWNC